MGRFERWARQSGRLRPVPGLLSAGLTCCLLGCGGGSQADIQPPPPPAADFVLNLSSSSVSVSEGGTSSPINVSISPLNGFSNQVQVSLGTLPAGVTASPNAPFSIAPGATVPLIFSAASNVPVGTINLTATGTSGSLTHAISLGITVQGSVAASLPRTNYTRTDSIANLDAPPGEPHHRHIALDST